MHTVVVWSRDVRLKSVPDWQLVATDSFNLRQCFHHYSPSAGGLLMYSNLLLPDIAWSERCSCITWSERCYLELHGVRGDCME